MDKQTLDKLVGIRERHPNRRVALGIAALTEMLILVLQRISELEEKIDRLEAKP
jgi:hypothetical protein